MADPALCPDIEQVHHSSRSHRAQNLGPRSSRATTRHNVGTSRPPMLSPTKVSSALNKDAKRRHRALEKQFSKAQQKAQTEKD